MKETLRGEVETEFLFGIVPKYLELAIDPLVILAPMGRERSSSVALLAENNLMHNICVFFRRQSTVAARDKKEKDGKKNRSKTIDCFHLFLISWIIHSNLIQYIKL